MTPLTQSLVLWGALTSGVVIFGGVVAFLKTSGTIPDANPDMAPIFGTVALVGAAVTFLSSYLIRPAIERRGKDPAIRLRMATLVTAALNEGGALLGLVMYLISSHTFAAAAATIGLIGLVLQMPTRGRFEACQE